MVPVRGCKIPAQRATETTPDAGHSPPIHPAEREGALLKLPDGKRPLDYHTFLD
jgi:hypothetical protein